MVTTIPSVVENLNAGVNAGIHPPSYRLPAAAHIGRVRLAISNLDRSAEFYSRVIGLAVLERAGDIVRLGAQDSNDVLLELEEVAGVQPIAKRTRLGLYHTAFLLPSRSALSSFVRHLQTLKVPFGAGDHLYSEALYLADPDGLSVEVYADRPRSAWIVEGQELVSATNPVDFAALLALPEDLWRGAPAGTTMGHVHLYVGDLPTAAQFYHAALGLSLMTWRYPGALFTSAGGYHHHVGLNVWAAGSPRASEQEARMLFWELVLPSEQERQRVVTSLEAAGYMQTTSRSGNPAFTDPWGIQVALVVAPAAV